MSRRGRWSVVAGLTVALFLSASCGGGVEGGYGDTAEVAAAPDFTLNLNTGGTFVLSEQTSPVLIIFWAEW